MGRSGKYRVVALLQLGALVGGLVVACGDGTSEPTGVVALEASPDTIYLVSGESVRLAVAALGADSNVVPGVLIAFSSSDETLVTVSALGEVRAVGQTGTATVTLSGGGASLTIPVFVFKPVALIDLNPGDTTIAPGESFPLRILVQDSDGQPIPTGAIVLASSDTTVAAVTPGGVVTATGRVGVAGILGARGPVWDTVRVRVELP